MDNNIQGMEEFESVIKQKNAVLAYFSTNECSVCKVLKPKVAELVNENFPEMEMVFIETNLFPRLAAQNKVFSVPTIIVFFEGKEFIRKVRTFSINELNTEINRIYQKMFD